MGAWHCYGKIDVEYLVYTQEERINEKLDLKSLVNFPVLSGKTFVASDELQMVSTPNWPQSYPSNLDCYWIIKSNGGKLIEVIINAGKMKSKEDFVEVKFFPITLFYKNRSLIFSQNLRTN